MEVGSRVRVKESVIVYHHPEHRNQPFDMKGSEGEVLNVIEELDGKPISANLPVQVLFLVGKKKLRAHFRPDEVEAVS
ncbi:MAG: ferredoxin-thioredoxin reductase variable chain [Sodalinema sp.]|uniref:ferredoxin-thioredoxin reductase variable chain n=1 Tax=Sodalinema sp. TaxID=3080550 RepID=UPI0011FF4B94|nr:MAG: ferredoxin--nitrite reductase [Phormidium sp. SL48-SHIP]